MLGGLRRGLAPPPRGVRPLGRLTRLLRVDEVTVPIVRTDRLLLSLHSRTGRLEIDIPPRGAVRRSGPGRLTAKPADGRTRRGGATTLTAGSVGIPRSTPTTPPGGQRCQVEEGPDAAERLNAAAGGEVGAKNLLAVAKEHAQAERLAVLIRLGRGVLPPQASKASPSWLRQPVCGRARYPGSMKRE